MTAVSPSRTSSPVRLRVVVLENRRATGPVVERAREGGPKAGDVAPAVDRVDVVREGEHVLRVRVVVLEGHLDDRRAFALLAVDRALVERLLVAVQVADERDEPALEVERALAVDPLVAKGDPDALGQVRRLAQALGDEIERVFRRLEHLAIRPEAGRGSPTLVRGSDLLDRRRRLAPGVFLGVDRAVAGRFHPHPLRERVDHAHADPVEAAGDLVARGIAAELAAGVEHGMDDFEGVLAGGMLADRHAAPVVLHGQRAVGPDRHEDLPGVAGHRLVDRVVDDLPDEVVEAAFVGRADVHARAPTDRLQPLQDLDARGGVVGGAGLALPGPGRGPVAADRPRRGCFLGHAGPPISRSYS